MPSRVFTLALIAGIVGVSTAQAAQPAQGFTYQGRVFNHDGTAPLTELVDLKLSIYDPSAGCLLYEEEHNDIDLGVSSGYFSVNVGSSLGVDGAKRTDDDPLLTMADVFSNAKEIRASGTPRCAAGYTPSAGHGRLLRVTVTPEGDSPIVLSPDLTIGATPLATVAETLQGRGPGDFIQKSTNVTQANIEALTGAGDIGGTLHHHDGRYAQSGAAASFSSVTVDGAEVCTKTYADQKLGGTALDLTGIGAGAGDGKALKWDATNAKWVAYTPAEASGNITGTATNVTGVVAIDHGGTGVTSLGTSQVLSSNSGGNGVTPITAGGVGDVLMQTGAGLGFSSIADANISASAAIARSKLASDEGSKGGLLFNSAASGAVSSLATGTAGQVLVSGGAGVAPSWSQPVYPYVMGGTYQGILGNAQILMLHPFPVNVTIPAGCTNSRFEFSVAAAASTTLSLKKCTGAGFSTCTEFGTAVVGASGKVATFTCASATSFTAGVDAITLTGPATADTTAANAGWAIYGTR